MTIKTITASALSSKMKTHILFFAPFYKITKAILMWLNKSSCHNELLLVQ